MLQSALPAVVKAREHWAYAHANCLYHQNGSYIEMGWLCAGQPAQRQHLQSFPVGSTRSLKSIMLSQHFHMPCSFTTIPLCPHHELRKHLLPSMCLLPCAYHGLGTTPQQQTPASLLPVQGLTFSCPRCLQEFLATVRPSNKTCCQWHVQCV